MQQSEAGRLKCDLIGGQFLKNLSATNLLTKVAQMFGDFAPKKFKTNLFLKMARSRPIFCLFWSFSRNNFNNAN